MKLPLTKLFNYCRTDLGFHICSCRLQFESPFTNVLKALCPFAIHPFSNHSVSPRAYGREEARDIPDGTQEVKPPRNGEGGYDG